MKLQPYSQVDTVPFTATPDDVRQMFGRPSRAGRNNIELDEMDYGSVVFRFQEGGRLEEVTKRAPIVHLGDVAVPFHVLEAFVREHDPNAFERAGFIVSPRFGLAFAPDCPSWVTALAEHCLPQWRAL